MKAYFMCLCLFLIGQLWGQNWASDYTPETTIIRNIIASRAAAGTLPFVPVGIDPARSNKLSTLKSIATSSGVAVGDTSQQVYFTNGNLAQRINCDNTITTLGAAPNGVEFIDVAKFGIDEAWLGDDGKVYFFTSPTNPVDLFDAGVGTTKIQLSNLDFFYLKADQDIYSFNGASHVQRTVNSKVDDIKYVEFFGDKDIFFTSINREEIVKLKLSNNSQSTIYSFTPAQVAAGHVGVNLAVDPNGNKIYFSTQNNDLASVSASSGGGFTILAPIGTNNDIDLAPTQNGLYVPFSTVGQPVMEVAVIVDPDRCPMHVMTTCTDVNGTIRGEEIDSKAVVQQGSAFTAKAEKDFEIKPGGSIFGTMEVLIENCPAK